MFPRDAFPSHGRFASWRSGGFGARRRRELISLCLLGLTLWAAVGLVQAHQVADSNPNPLAESLTQDLVNLGTRHQVAHPDRKAPLLHDLLAVATERQQLLSALAADDPGEVIRVALPADFRAGLPLEVQALVEEEMELEGELEILHEDRDVGSRYLHFLQIAGTRFALHFAADPPTTLATGARIRAKGIRVEQVLALSSGSTSVQALATVQPNTFGAQKTLVLLVNFQDLATQPYTTTYAQDVVFTQSSQFDLENSYGQTWLTGDVFGWYTLPMNSTVCDYSTLATYAQQAATNAGITLSAYTRYVYAFPKNACTWWGLGTVGGNPSKAWINGDFLRQVTTHEMGHNLGLYHSHSLDCGAVALGGTCTTSDYGDILDTMGNAKGHYNAFQKERLGWLNYGTSPAITTVQSNGVYAITPFETPDAGPKALAILQSTNATTGKQTWFYIEYRQALGFDSFVTSTSTYNITQGVVIHTGSPSDGNSSNLLDMTPATTTWYDPALVVGQSFTDATSGITITPQTVSSTQATVAINFGTPACVRANPTVTLSPSATQKSQPGATVSYSVTVTNNDNSGCAASAFALQTTVPTGWAGTLAAAQVSLNPGTSASTTLSVTSSTSTPDGTYAVSVGATNSTATAYGASASGSIQILACVQANPTVTLSPSATQQSQPGATVSYSVTVTNKHTLGCTASTFTLQAAVPTGWTATLASGQLPLSPGASAATTLNVTSPVGASSGTYPVSVTATDSAAPTYKATASGSVQLVVPVTLAVSVATDKTSYTRGQNVTVTSVVTQNGTPVANVAVTFTITKANGSVVTGTGTTGSNGQAVFSYRLKKADPVGSYKSTAAASMNGTSSSATTGFSVQ